MHKLFRLSNTVKRDLAIDSWLREHPDKLGAIAQHWFNVMRKRGNDVRELFHDGFAVACVGDAAFGYVNVFKAHVNVGFFRGSELNDPKGLMEGTGKNMRHVKVKLGSEIDTAALLQLIDTAYVDMKNRLED